MNTTIDAEYRIPTMESVVHDTPKTPLTDLERAQFEAITAAHNRHVVDPNTELYDQARIETFGSETLDIVAGTVQRSEFDWTDMNQLRTVGKYVVQYRRIEKTTPRK